MITAIAALLAYQGHSLLPTMGDEERTTYRIAGAGLMWQSMQALRSLVTIAGALGGVKRK